MLAMLFKYVKTDNLDLVICNLGNKIASLTVDNRCNMLYICNFERILRLLQSLHGPLKGKHIYSWSMGWTMRNQWTENSSKICHVLDVLSKPATTLRMLVFVSRLGVGSQ